MTRKETLNTASDSNTHYPLPHLSTYLLYHLFLETSRRRSKIESVHKLQVKYSVRRINAQALTAQKESVHKLLQLKKNQCFSLKGSSVINTYKTHRITSQTIQVYLIVTALYKFILWWYWYSKASFFSPSWWVTIQLVKLMSIPLSFTHINNKKNQWITRPHNIQKSLNKTNISICITTTSCLPPIWSSRPALLLTGCGFLRMTRAQYHAQESEYENTPPCIRGSGMLLSQLPLIHSQPYEIIAYLCFNWWKYVPEP